MTLKCALCNRTIDEKDPKYVHGVGYVGTHCHRKVARIEERLAELGLAELLEGRTFPLVYSPERGAFQYSPEHTAFIEKAQKAGVYLKGTVKPGESGPVAHIAIASKSLLMLTEQKAKKAPQRHQIGVQA